MNARVLGLLGLALVAACASPAAEDSAESGNALSGGVAIGTEVETTTSVHIRRSASTSDDQNILGTLPPGTKVKVLASDPVDGFYNVEVLDSALVKALKTSKGWCSGKYLLGGTAEPETSDTGVAKTLKAQFVSKNCRPMKDDNGAFMKPTVDDFVINAGGKIDFAVMEVNSSALPYGTMLHIPELDALPAIAGKGRPVEFKVVKTAESASAEPLTVTLCTTASGFLPPAGTELTLAVAK